MGLVGGNGSSSCVGWAGNSQPNKTLDCVDFMLNCQKEAIQPTPPSTTNGVIFPLVIDLERW